MFVKWCQIWHNMCQMCADTQTTTKPARQIPDPPWSRMKGESDVNFERFQFFCDLGPGRIPSDVAQKYGVDTRTIQNTSGPWKWRERASAWDDEQARARARAKTTEVEQQAREHLERWGMIGDKALAAFELYDPSELKPRDALAMIDRATHYQRLTRGEVTERTETRGHVLDTSALTDDEILLLRQLLAKCGYQG